MGSGFLGFLGFLGVSDLGFRGFRVQGGHYCKKVATIDKGMVCNIAFSLDVRFKLQVQDVVSRFRV